MSSAYGSLSLRSSHRAVAAAGASASTPSLARGGALLREAGLALGRAFSGGTLSRGAGRALARGDSAPGPGPVPRDSALAALPLREARLVPVGFVFTWQASTQAPPGSRERSRTSERERGRRNSLDSAGFGLEVPLERAASWHNALTATQSRIGTSVLRGPNRTARRR